MCIYSQKLSYSTPSLSSDVPASQCAQEDISIFTQSPWTDMLTDLDLNGEIIILYVHTVYNMDTMYNVH